MAENEVMLYGANDAQIVAKRTNYEITGVMGGQAQTLKRDVDFGVLPKTKKPTLFKSGAEKIIKAYGLLPRFTIESKIEQGGDNPFFYYAVRCDLVKIHPQTGQEYVFASGFGSGNTGERRCGFAGAYDSANNALKMASKRALVMAAITIGGISSMFEQDMDNEDFMKGYTEVVDTQSDDAPVNAKQIKRLYAIGGDAGLNAAQVKNKIIALGYASTKDITQGKYEEVCKALQEGN